MTAKTKGLKALIGRPIMMKHRYERDPEGPYILADVDPPFVAITYTEKQRTVWLNSRLIEYLTEVTSSVQQQ